MQPGRAPAHTSCGATEWQTKAAGTHHDRECAAHTSCTATEWQTKAAGTHHDRECAAHTSCAALEWQTKEAGTHHDRECAAHTSCTTTEWQTKEAGTHHDRECTAHTSCIETEWQTKEAGTHHDRECKAHTVCSAIEWMTKAAGTHHDRECSAQQECPNLTCRKDHGMIFVMHHHKDHEYGLKYHHCSFRPGLGRCVCICNSRWAVDPQAKQSRPLTAPPTPSPTPQPTAAPCNDGKHTCDFDHGMCVAAGKKFVCRCSHGYFGNGHTCKPWTKCTQGQYEVKQPSSASDRVCA